MTIGNSQQRITAVFAGPQEAESAVADLRRLGVTNDHISYVSHGRHAGMSDNDGAFDTTSGETRDRPRDAADGALKGLGAGAVVGALFGLAAAAIPGVGPFVTAGVLASTLGAAGGAAVGGAIVGGAAGSLAGTLAQLGFAHDEARYYGERVEQGGILVSVEPTSGHPANEIRDILVRNGGQVYGADTASTGLGASSLGAASTLASGVGTTTTSSTSTSGAYGTGATTGGERLVTGTTNYTDGLTTRDQTDTRLRDLDTQLARTDLDEPLRVRLMEERLLVEKHREHLGSVEIGKHVETQQQQVNVELRHQEVVIERHAVTNPTPVEGNVTLGADSQTVRVDLEAERANVRKQAYVTEEVEIGKRSETETQTFTETVGREVLDVRQTGDVDVRGDDPNTPNNPNNPNRR